MARTSGPVGGRCDSFPPRSKNIFRSPPSTSSAPIISARGIASLAGRCCIAGSSPLKLLIIAIVNGKGLMFVWPSHQNAKVSLVG
jgi:hypothetical protein